ncbi:phosphoglycolate phosphatase [Paraburkholderia kururiensis]|uniref:phosphoglycolate phosphatase n=1 Tax=Paraburkholderia kururiensis TaxID=984307 RepID=UPI0005A94997|nr:phosphoglycolate phosphatase [Paraburkholderia kururiensis]
MSGPTRAVLVDLDGTMVDTAADIAAAVNFMLAEFGAEPLTLETVRGLIGRGVPALVRRSLEAARLDRRLSAGRAEPVFHHYYAQVNGRLGTVYSGVTEGLAALKREGYALACVTNKPRSLAAPLLALTGLSRHLDALVAGDSIAHMKPAPEPLWHAAELLGADAANTVLVGDSPVDVAAAQAAGMPVFIVTYGYAGPNGAQALPCDGLIDSFEMLPALLARARVVSEQ